MKNFSFWQKWLFGISSMILVGGISISLLSSTLIYDLFDKLLSPVFWGTNLVTNSAKEAQGFIYAVLGSIIASWGIFMIFIVHIPFRNRERWAWNCVFAGSLMWFILDSGFSIYYKVYINFAMNFILLILLMLPILFTRKYFSSQS